MVGYFKRQEMLTKLQELIGGFLINYRFVFEVRRRTQFLETLEKTWYHVETVNIYTYKYF